MLPDGRVGFIDFGIVGRISPVTWKGVEAFVTSMAVSAGSAWKNKRVFYFHDPLVQFV